MRIKGTLSRLAAIVAIGAAGLGSVSHAAVDMFIKISGVDGETADKPHRGASDLESWSWAMTGIIGEKSRPTFSQLSIRKRIDKASPLLMKAMAEGANFARVTITLRSQSATRVEFARLVLEDVNLTGILIGLSVASEDFSEELTLNYRRIGIEYFTIEANERSQFAWSIPENTEGGVTFPGQKPVDSDNDGLPDEWEVRYNLNPQLDDAGMDGDRDGASNLDEYIAGTSPVDPNQVFRSQLSYTPGGQGVTLSWSSAEGKTYRIFSSETLGVPFSAQQTVGSAGNGTTTVTLPLGALNRFFRVEVAE